MTKKTIQFLSIAFVMMLGFGGMQQSAEAWSASSLFHHGTSNLLGRIGADPCLVACRGGECNQTCMNCYTHHLGENSKGQANSAKGFDLCGETYDTCTGDTACDVDEDNGIDNPTLCSGVGMAPSC